jgi:hypothetical protein
MFEKIEYILLIEINNIYSIFHCHGHGHGRVDPARARPGPARPAGPARPGRPGPDGRTAGLAGRIRRRAEWAAPSAMCAGPAGGGDSPGGSAWRWLLRVRGGVRRSAPPPWPLPPVCTRRHPSPSSGGGRWRWRWRPRPGCGGSGWWLARRRSCGRRSGRW